MLETDMRKSINGILGILPATRQVEIGEWGFSIGGNHVSYYFIGLQKNKKKSRKL